LCNCGRGNFILHETIMGCFYFLGVALNITICHELKKLPHKETASRVEI
ncbi:MAG: hypothetical protein PWP31_1890, partial [Clostridia bacterium]|nr:hypothetical protein [Clostridia bacterium]